MHTPDGAPGERKSAPPIFNHQAQTGRKRKPKMKKTKTKKPTAAPTNADEPKEVVCRFRPSELDAMKHDTGAEKDGAAVAAYVRKRMRRESVAA